MKKQTKKELNAMGWSEITGTSDLHKVRQSINQKTERSEQDVIKTLSWTIAALFVLQLLDLVISIASI